MSNSKNVTHIVFILMFLLSWQPISYSQEISKPVTYRAEIKPLGDGIDWDFELPDPDDFDPLRLRFKFLLSPGTVEAELAGNVIFNQNNQMLRVEPRSIFDDKTDDSDTLFSGRFKSTGGLILNAEYIFDFTLPIPFFEDIHINHTVPMPGFKQIDAGWDEEKFFDSFLLGTNIDGEPESVQLDAGVRKIISVDLTVVEIAGAIVEAYTGRISKPLVDVLEKIVNNNLADAGISLNGGLINRLKLSGDGIYLNDLLTTSEGQSIPARGLNTDLNSYSIHSSYVEDFTLALDLVISSDVFLHFSPLGIDLWNYEKTIAELPIPIIPEKKLDTLVFTSEPDTITFPLKATDDASTPLPIGTIPYQSLTLGGSARTVDVAQYFSSENNLTYEIQVNPTGIVTASVSGSRVTITPASAGVTTVVVTARDTVNTDLTAIQTISVVVRQTSAVIVRPPNNDPTFTVPDNSNPSAEGLREGVSVIIQNVPLTGPGLNLRSNPWIGNNEIRKLWDGATGIITDGPEENNGYTWWKIEWDQVDIEAWSVESFGGDQLLFRRPPDLEIRGLDVNESQVGIGEEIKLEVEIQNNGPGESAGTDVYFYYHSGSRNDNLEELSRERDLRIPGAGKLRVPSLRERRRTTLTLTVDAPTTPDRYYYGAFLPSNVHDTDYQGDLTIGMISNNLASEQRVTVTGRPDYIVESIRVSKTTLDPGERFTLRVTVRNQGLGEPTSSADLDYYRSSDARISTSDSWVGDDSVSRLDTDETGNESISLTAPTDPGVYYYGACVSDVRNESNDNNNCSAAVAITVHNLQTVDVNRDGVVNIQDLVLVASSFGETGANNADVNGDGVVNIQDLVLVAAAFGNSASAPAIYYQAADPLDASDVQHWLSQAQQLNLTDAISQRGILFLEQLLAVLTPKKTALLPNYPNPFNPETWIPYQLATPADVSISIYAANGTLVRTLDLGHEPVGIYQKRSRAAYWDGRNSVGESVASGIYFYTLTAGDFTATRKMLIRK